MTNIENNESAFVRDDELYNKKILTFEVSIFFQYEIFLKFNGSMENFVIL